MAFQTAVTIRSVLESVEHRKYVLPAIQREFVWRPDQIECLFDSLMRGYPIGSFLFWIVKRENIEKYRFYDFMLDYHERDNAHCASVGEVTRDETTAVLDGQQRLTALNIGIRGSYAHKLPRLWWNSPHAFPKRRLYLNIIGEAEENEAGMQYDFRFLNDADAKAGRDDRHCWYRVGEILKAKSAVPLHKFLVEEQLGNLDEPFEVLDRLHKVVHTDQVIAYYKEEDQDLDKVLDIFIRTNSGGTTLSYSDMLMSMATAQWEKLDAREAIHGTVDEINQIGDGFGFSQDFLLKAGLMLAGVSNVRFNVTNFNRGNMKLLEDRWDFITRAVRTSVELVASFGFSQSSLSANNAVLPIAHYLYRRDIPTGFLSHATYRKDRESVRIWLIRSLLKRGIWGSGLDSLLTALRSVIDSHGGEGFPSNELEVAMRTRGKSLTFEEEEFEDLVESKDRSFTLLSLLYPFVDLQNSKFHIDHVFPKSRFSAKRLLSADVPENDIPEFQDRANRLPNLQLLVGEANQSKSDTLPHKWMLETFDSEAARAYAQRHDLGEVPSDMTGFSAFYEARRDRLLRRLRDLLGTYRHEYTGKRRQDTGHVSDTARH
ncbi:MAG: DUF262 domain-containing protein [Bryobacterales bacterium]|nr:DUF262 domain-containing protein [Bryobacterales bacterium]